MNRILFAETDPSAVAALRELMAAMPDWNAAFATSRQQVFHALSNTRFDVIVCEMRLDGHSSIDLLEQVRIQHPAVIRVLMAQPVEGPEFDRGVEVAQRLITKPVLADELALLLQGLAGAQQRGRNPLVRTLVGRVGIMPSSNDVLQQLEPLLRQGGNAPIQKIASVIGTDPALSAKVLQIINSAWFGLRQPSDNIAHAVGMMGMTPLRALLLMSQLMASGRPPLATGFSVGRLQERSLLTARLARALVDDPVQRDTAFTAGLLHDVGMLVLAMGMQSRYALTLRHARRSDRPLAEVEASFIGASHDKVGGYLAEVWGLPEAVVHSIERHHDGHAGLGRHAVIVQATQTAQRVAHAVERQNASAESLALTTDQSLRLSNELESMGLGFTTRTPGTVTPPPLPVDVLQ